MNRVKTFSAVPFVLLALAGAVACGDDDDVTPSPDGGTVDSGNRPDTGTPDSSTPDSSTADTGTDAGNDSAAPSPPDGHVLLTNNRIAAFSTKSSAALGAPAAITGLTAGDNLVGIDRRPMNGFLYGLGFNSTAGTVTLYAIHPDTSTAVAVGAPQSFVNAVGAAAPITGTSFGFDFNPAVDRIRITTSTGQNFRMNPNNGAAVDGDAANAGIQMDGAINGGPTSVGEVAYTNNVGINGAITSLYTVDAASDKIYIQNPPNMGTQSAGISLSKQIDAVLGFDILPGVDVAASNAAVTAGTGYAVVKLAGQTAETLVQINLVTGAITAETPMGAGNAGVIGMALHAPLATQVVGLSATGDSLIRFTTAAPATVSTVTTGTAPAPFVPITAGETLVGIDWRPATGQLMGLGVDATADTATLYLIDPLGGGLSIVGGTASQIKFVTTAAAAIDFPPASTGWGFDFNPQVDRIRVVTGSGLNLRLNPTNGLPVDSDMDATNGINPDATINGAATSLEAAAYTNGGGTTVTTLYGLSAATNSLYIVNPPNNGVLTAALPIKLNGTDLDFTAVSGFDMQPAVAVATGNAAATGTALAGLTVGGTTGLYSINLATGAATLVGNIGNGQTALAGMAIAQTTIVK